MNITAEEYFAKRYKELGINHVDEINGEDEQIAIEFARFHVQKALENVWDCGTNCFGDRFYTSKDSITHAYPLKNIK